MKEKIRSVYRDHKEVILYLFFGGLTTVVSLLAYGIPVAFGVDALAANIISWFLAVAFAYVTNSIWVFDGHTESLRAKGRQIFDFYAGRLATLAMEEAILFLFIRIFHQNEYLVKLAAQVLVVIGNYGISKFLVFGKKKAVDK